MYHLHYYLKTKASRQLITINSHKGDPADIGQVRLTKWLQNDSRRTAKQRIIVLAGTGQIHEFITVPPFAGACHIRTGIPRSAGTCPHVTGPLFGGTRHKFVRGGSSGDGILSCSLRCRCAGWSYLPFSLYIGDPRLLVFRCVLSSLFELHLPQKVIVLSQQFLQVTFN